MIKQTKYRNLHIKMSARREVKTRKGILYEFYLFLGPFFLPDIVLIKKEVELRKKDKDRYAESLLDVSESLVNSGFFDERGMKKLYIELLCRSKYNYRKKVSYNLITDDNSFSFQLLNLTELKNIRNRTDLNVIVPKDTNKKIELFDQLVATIISGVNLNCVAGQEKGVINDRLRRVYNHPLLRKELVLLKKMSGFSTSAIQKITSLYTYLLREKRIRTI